ncbi:MAG: hypothetical protein V7L11_03420 [Nostoc sp.]
MKRVSKALHENVLGTGIFTEYFRTMVKAPPLVGGLSISALSTLHSALAQRKPLFPLVTAVFANKIKVYLYAHFDTFSNWVYTLDKNN